MQQGELFVSRSIPLISKLFFYFKHCQSLLVSVVRCFFGVISNVITKAGFFIIVNVWQKKKKKKIVQQWLQSHGAGKSPEMVAICALINLPQCIASLFVQLISDLFSLIQSCSESVSCAIIWKLVAPSVESHKVCFDNRSYRNYLFSYNRRQAIINLLKILTRLRGLGELELMIYQSSLLFFYYLMSRTQRKSLSK